ncbi:MAG: YHS domain-containing protein [Calditrichaeota bacterium]|nr:YHS domain-containing protein [Calditrichota bacterium]
MFRYCAVCGVRVNRNKAYARKEYKGIEYLLCCPLCQKEFEQDPEKHIQNSRKK